MLDWKFPITGVKMCLTGVLQLEKLQRGGVCLGLDAKSTCIDEIEASTTEFDLLGASFRMEASSTASVWQVESEALTRISGFLSEAS